MPSHKDLPIDLKNLLADAVEFAISAKKSTDFRFPFILTESGSEKQHIVHSTDDDDPVDSARRSLRSDLSTINCYLIAYDGILKAVDGSDLLAFIFECADRSLDEGFVFFQRYKQDDQGIVLISGDSRNGFLRRTNSLFS